MVLVAPLQISLTYLAHFALLRLSGTLPAGRAGAWLEARGAGVVWGTFAGFLYYWMIAAVYWAAEFQRLFRAERLQAAQLEASLAAARLDALRAQLQPHFLFNTLNAISVLTADDPRRAKQMVLRLSDLLRASMAGTEGPRADRLSRVLRDLPDSRSGGPPLERVVVRDQETLFFVETAAIDWVEAAGNYVRLHVGARRHLIRGTLTRHAERLGTGNFVRIRRSALVNVRAIASLERYGKASYAITLRSGATLVSSRYYVQRIRALLGT